MSPEKTKTGSKAAAPSEHRKQSAQSTAQFAGCASGQSTSTKQPSQKTSSNKLPSTKGIPARSTDHVDTYLNHPDYYDPTRKSKKPPDVLKEAHALGASSGGTMYDGEREQLAAAPHDEPTLAGIGSSFDHGAAM